MLDDMIDNDVTHPPQEKKMYRFMVRGPRGDREYRSVKEAFDNRDAAEVVEILCGGNYYRVLRP
jgi:hypothetical protein